MLNAITVGSLASSPISLSAGGQDEQPCEVKSSTTARGSAVAGPTAATMAPQTPKETPKAPDHRETELTAIIAVNFVAILTQARSQMPSDTGLLRDLCI